MEKAEEKYEDIIRISEKAFGKAKGGKAKIRDSCNCKGDDGCKQDCQDYVSNIASTSGFWAGTNMG